MIKCPFAPPGRRWRAENLWSLPIRRHSSSRPLRRSPRPLLELRSARQWRFSAWPVGIWRSTAEHQFPTPLSPLFFHSYGGTHRSHCASSGVLLPISWESPCPELPSTARSVHWWWEKSSLIFYTPLALQRHRYLRAIRSYLETLCALLISMCSTWGCAWQCHIGFHGLRCSPPALRAGSRGICCEWRSQGGRRGH